MVSGITSGTRQAELRNELQPFQIDGLQLSGRVVRLGTVVDEVLSKHDYPFPVSRLLAELMTVTAVLGGGFKFDGRLSAEVRGDGPVPLLVVDFTSAGGLRGYASLRDGDIAELSILDEPRTLTALVGKGTLLLTFDQGPDTRLYQSVVALDGESVTECIRKYFVQSEQVDTGLSLAVECIENRWHAGAVALQRLAELGPGGEPVLHEARQDAWNTAMLLLGTLKESELTNPDTTVHDLLYTLFHEFGVRVFERRDLRFECNCSAYNARAILERMPVEERAEFYIDNVIEVVCEFCSRKQVFHSEDLESLTPPM